MQLLYRLDDINPPDASHIERCCVEEITSAEIELLDDLPSLLPTLDNSEFQSLYYICGYIAFKEAIVDEGSAEHPDCSDFTSFVNRGKLSYPPATLFQFSVSCYAFFKKHGDVFSCLLRLRKMFKLICESFYLSVEPLDPVCRRLSNVFLKGLVTFHDDMIRSQKDEQNSRKKRKFK